MRSFRLAFVAATLCAGVPTALLTAQGAAPAQTPAPEKAPAGFASPTEVFAAARQAFNERRWVDFLETVSPEQRDPLVGQMAVALSSLQRQPGSDPRLTALLNQYFPDGVDPARFAAAPGEEPRPLTEVYAELGRSPADPGAFFSDATQLVMSLEHGDQADEVRVAEMGDLRPYKTADGVSNRAVQAEVALVRPDVKTPRRDLWSFVVIDKRWYLAPLGTE